LISMSRDKGESEIAGTRTPRGSVENVAWMRTSTKAYAGTVTKSRSTSGGQKPPYNTNSVKFLRIRHLRSRFTALPGDAEAPELEGRSVDRLAPLDVTASRPLVREPVLDASLPDRRQRGPLESSIVPLCGCDRRSATSTSRWGHRLGPIPRRRNGVHPGIPSFVDEPAPAGPGLLRGPVRHIQPEVLCVGYGRVRLVRVRSADRGVEPRRTPADRGAVGHPARHHGAPAGRARP